jgi:hypothetical protein
MRGLSWLLLAVLAVPLAVVLILWVAFQMLPRPSVLVTLLVAYGISVGIFLVPGVRFAHAWTAALRAGRADPDASVWVIRDISLLVPTRFGAAPMKVDTGVMVVSSGRLTLLSRSGADGEILRARHPMSIRLAEAPAHPFVDFFHRPAIHVQADGIEAQSRWWRPTP